MKEFYTKKVGPQIALRINEPFDHRHKLEEIWNYFAIEKENKMFYLGTTFHISSDIHSMCLKDIWKFKILI